MLTLPEKIVFVLGTLATLYAIFLVSRRIIRIIGRGKGKVDWGIIPKRLFPTLFKTITFQPVFRLRFWPSLFHGFVAWGFIYYLLVNLGDVLQGFIPGFLFLGQGPVGGIYRLIGDILSVAVLVGMVALIIRRWVLQPSTLTTRKDVLLQEKARAGIRRELGHRRRFHPGSRWLALPGAVGGGGDCARPLAAIRNRGLQPVGRHEPFHPDHPGAHLLLAGDRHHPGLLPLFPDLQAHPPVLCPAQLPAQARAPLDRRARQDRFRRRKPGAVRRYPPGRPGLGADHGRLRLHHVLPLPAGLPGL